MIASMIGIGVGIDYALFVVTRHRGFLHEGKDPVEAAALANATAGTAVLFAGSTVVVALIGLLLAGIPSIATMGYAAAITVAVAMAGAVTLLPAFLGLAGHRIDRWKIGRRAHTGDSGQGRPPDAVGPLGRPRRSSPVAVRDRRLRRPGGDRRPGARHAHRHRRRRRRRHRPHLPACLRPVRRRLRSGLQRPVHAGRRQQRRRQPRPG